jgi:hypothetical protein
MDSGFAMVLNGFSRRDLLEKRRVIADIIGDCAGMRALKSAPPSIPKTAPPPSTSSPPPTALASNAGGLAAGVRAKRGRPL